MKTAGRKVGVAQQGAEARIIRCFRNCALGKIDRDRQIVRVERRQSTGGKARVDIRFPSEMGSGANARFVGRTSGDH